MHTTTNNPVARLLAPIGKLTLALFGAAAIGTAQAADNVWEGDDDGYWETEANWSNPSGDYWVINGNATSKAVKFNSNPTLGYTLAIVTDGVTFSGDSASDGLVQTAGDVRLGAWANGALTISSGTHVLNELAVSSAWWDNTGPVDGTLTVSGGSLTVNTTTWVGSGQSANAAGSDGVINVSGGSVKFVGTPTLGCVAGATGTLNLNSGTATASTIVQGGGTGYVNFDGGTLAAAAAGTLIGDGLTVALNAAGGTIATDYDVTVVPAMTGTGSLTKTGAGVLTLSTMPTFSGTITVAADAGSVILPSGATIAAGKYTATRTVENGVEYYSNPPLTITQDDIAGDSIILANDTTLNVTANANFGNLTVSGPYTLTLAGSSAITATSLNIAAGTTVQLVSATTLATGPLQTSLVTGSGTIVYDAVPDGTASDLKPDEAGYTASTWTGTVWIQNCIYRTATGSLWTDPAAYGNSGSKVKFTNARIYLKAGVDCDAEIVLSNIDSTGASKTFGLMLTDGNGGQVNKFAKLSGDGTFSISGSGGATEIISIRDIVDFSGVFNLPSRIVVIGDQDGTIAQQYVGFANTGAIVIPEGVSVSVPSDKTWVLGHGFVGAGTLKYTYPWQVGTSSLSNGDYWTGTVELAACVNNGSGSVAVYPGRMGNANSKIVFKGLAPGETKGYYFNGSTDAAIQLDGDVTISDGSSSAKYSLGVLTGTGSFSGATSLGTACTFAFSAVSNYTGMISANSKSLVTIGTYITDSAVSAGQKLVSVDSSANGVTINNSATVSGETQYIATALQDGADGYGIYVTAVQRDVYWVGGASGNWSDTTAWALADGTPLNAYPSDYTQNAGDNVIFTNNAVVVADCRPVITKMTLNADVTLSTTDAFVANTYTGKKYLFVETVEGEGTLTLSNAVIAAIGNGRPFKIYSPVCIAEGTSNAFGCSTYVNYLYGNLSGSGDIKVGNGNWGGLSLQGDNSAFSGQFESTQGGTRNASNFSGAQASSALASWTISAQSQNGVNTSTYLTDNSTYYFGALNGYLQLGEKSGAPILEIGARDEDCECQLVGRHDDGKSIYRRYNITKVGTSKFTIKEGSTQPGTIDIKSGTVVFPDDIAMAFYTSIKFSGAGAQLTYNGVADLSGYIANSSSAIVIDTDAYVTWATALAASNVGGLTKKGTGTLTLTAVPQYGGQTVVEAGELVVPAGTQLESLSGSGKLVVDLANTDATGVLFALGNIADGASYEVRNEPAALNTVRTDKGVIYYVGEPKTYVWVGPSGDDYNWSTLSNWSVNDATPMEPPTAIDIVQFSPDASVVVDAAATALSITAGGALTVTANYDLAVTGDIAVNGVLTKWGMASVSANGAITADSVAIGTGAVVALSGSDPTSLTLDVGSTSAYAIDDAASSNGYGAKYSVLGDGTLVLSGHGQVNAAGNQTVYVAEANTTNSFTGFLSGSMSLAKTGAGTLALFGNNTFTGDVAIEAGSIKLNTPLDLGDVRCDFDASNAGITYSANVLRWQDAAQPNNANAFLWTDTASGTNPDFVENGAIFNGKKVLYSDSFRMVEPNVSPHNSSFPKTTFFVMQNTEGGTQVIAGDNNDTVSPTRWTVAWRNYGYMTRFGNDGSSSWNSNAIWANGILAIQNNNPGQGENGGASFGSNPVVLTIVRNFSGNNEGWMDSRYAAHRAFIGGSGKQAWAEYLTYTREFSFDEKAAVEQYLMAKWGINNMEYTVLPKTADVTMKAGATLDMGGLTQTVKSFTGAGTVTNGSLKTTGDLVATGSLTIQSVEGQTYTLSTDRRDVVTFTGAATGYFVQPQADAAAASRFTVPNGLTVGFDRDGDFDVTIINAPNKWTLSAHVGAEATTYRIGSYPFRLYLR